MSKRVYPVSDAQMRRDANNNKGYNDRVERMEVALKARYGEAYKRWPEDYLKAPAPNALAQADAACGVSPGAEC